MKTTKLITGTVLILIALACAIVMLTTRDVPKETIRETTTTTTTTTTQKPTEAASTAECTTSTTTTKKVTESRTEPNSTKHTTTMRVFVNEEYIAPEYFRIMGVISDGTYDYTWYSERVLPGKGLDIPGRHSDGNYVRDGDGYIVLASSELPKGTIIDTPFGWGKVYDSGCPYGVIDVYTSW